MMGVALQVLTAGCWPGGFFSSTRRCYRFEAHETHPDGICCSKQSLQCDTLLTLRIRRLLVARERSIPGHK